MNKSEIILYHGNYKEIKLPGIDERGFAKDFYFGFYCTEVKQVAEVRASYFTTPIVNVYKLKNIETLRVKEFKDYNDEWLKFIMHCRNGNPHGYDVVIGPIADDTIYEYMDAYYCDQMNKEYFFELMKLKYPNHQISLHTYKALNSIDFIESYQPLIGISSTQKKITIEEHNSMQKQYPNMKVEYYNGEMVLSSHSSNRHNEIVGNILITLKSFLKRTDYKVYHEQMEVILGYNTDNKQFVFPDVFIVSKDDIDEVIDEIFTTPPKVIFEVVSPGEEAIRDRYNKLCLYEDYGVVEYNTVEQTGFILQYTLTNGLYKQTGAFKVGEIYKSTAIEGLIFEVDNIFKEE